MGVLVTFGDKEHGFTMISNNIIGSSTQCDNIRIYNANKDESIEIDWRPTIVIGMLGDIRYLDCIDEIYDKMLWLYKRRRSCVYPINIRYIEECRQEIFAILSDRLAIQIPGALVDAKEPLIVNGIMLIVDNQAYSIDSKGHIDEIEGIMILSEETDDHDPEDIAIMSTFISFEDNKASFLDTPILAAMKLMSAAASATLLDIRNLSIMSTKDYQLIYPVLRLSLLTDDTMGNFIIY